MFIYISTFNSMVSQHLFFLLVFFKKIASHFLNISCRLMLELLNMSELQQNLLLKDLLVAVCHSYSKRLSDAELKPSLMIWIVKCYRGHTPGSV